MAAADSDALRPCQRSPRFRVNAAPELAEAWAWSAERYRQISDAIADSLPDFVACAAVSGSLARMEAHPASDIDLVIVVDDRFNVVSDQEANACFNAVWDRLDALGAVRPKPGGIFSRCARWKDLINPASRGRIDEDITIFGHRIQLLMDAQPLTAAGRFVEVQRSILQWYSETRLVQTFSEPGPFHWLWQDVQRYWRSLRARTCWINADNEPKSLALNVKLRSSRMMLVFAFLLVLQRAQYEQPNQLTMTDSLLEMLTATPAERLFGANDVVSIWETIWVYLRDTASSPPSTVPAPIRDALNELADSVARTVTGSGDLNRNRQWLI